MNLSTNIQELIIIILFSFHLNQRKNIQRYRGCFKTKINNQRTLSIFKKKV